MRPGRSVRPKIRLTRSGIDLTTILRCFLSFKTVVTSRNIIVFKIKFSRPKHGRPSRARSYVPRAASCPPPTRARTLSLGLTSETRGCPRFGERAAQRALVCVCVRAYACKFSGAAAGPALLAPPSRTTAPHTSTAHEFRCEDFGQFSVLFLRFLTPHLTIPSVLFKLLGLDSSLL